MLSLLQFTVNCICEYFFYPLFLMLKVDTIIKDNDKNLLNFNVSVFSKYIYNYKIFQSFTMCLIM